MEKSAISEITSLQHIRSLPIVFQNDQPLPDEQAPSAARIRPRNKAALETLGRKVAKIERIL
jgi:hypothetical protein